MRFGFNQKRFRIPNGVPEAMTVHQKDGKVHKHSASIARDRNLLQIGVNRDRSITTQPLRRAIWEWLTLLKTEKL
jgi:hypothetical protein